MDRKMKKEYALLEHIIEIDEYDDDIKYIGIYETEDEAYDAIDLFVDKPGFRDYPDGFNVYLFTPGITMWESGFFTGSGDD